MEVAVFNTEKELLPATRHPATLAKATAIYLWALALGLPSTDREVVDATGFRLTHRSTGPYTIGN
jgi:transcription initiation factor TFIIIB Brf1 subunit/transcription initiation factor TFIIB